MNIPLCVASSYSRWALGGRCALRIGVGARSAGAQSGCLGDRCEELQQLGRAALHLLKSHVARAWDAGVSS